MKLCAIIGTKLQNTNIENIYLALKFYNGPLNFMSKLTFDLALDILQRSLCSKFRESTIKCFAMFGTKLH